MRLFTIHRQENHSEIEQLLLSNITTRQARQSVEMLFGTLSMARNTSAPQAGPPAARAYNGLKNVGARVLYAYGALVPSQYSTGAPTGDAARDDRLDGYKMPATTGLQPEYRETRFRRDTVQAGEGPDPLSPEDIRAKLYIEQRNKVWSNNKPIIDLDLQNKNIATLMDQLSWNDVDSNNTQLTQAMNLVDHTARFLIATPEGLARIAYVLLRGSGLYGASPGERLTTNVMSGIVDDWMAENVFGSGVEGFVARRMLGILPSGERDPTYGSAHVDVKSTLAAINAMLALFNTGGAAAERESSSYRYLLAHVVAPAMPTLFFSREDFPPEALELGTLDWCYLHIGLSFAAKSALDIGDMTASEIIEIGCTLSALLMMGSQSAVLIDIISFPALLHYLNTMLAADRNAALKIDVRADVTQKDALHHFFFSGEAREKAVNPFKQFGDAMGGYKSRTLLARDILLKHCGDWTESEHARRLEEYKNQPGTYRCPAAPASKPGQTDRNKDLNNLPDLNNAFEEQNKNITDKFAVIDGLMIMDTLMALPAAELDFIAAAIIRKAGADFSQLNPLTGMPVEYFITGAKPAVQMLPGIELLLASGKGEERIFALGRDNTGYWLRRVDRDKENYFQLMAINLAGADKNYRLNVYAGENTQGLYKTAGESLRILSEKLNRQHTKILANELYNQGYEETSQEAIYHFLLSFIPFYHCAKWNPHRQEEALISCALDGLNFIPLAGKAATLSSRVLAKAGMGGMASLRIAQGGYAAGAGVKSAINMGVRTFVNVAMTSVLEEFDRKALTSMLIALARSLDPGIELTGMLGKSAVLQVRNAARLLRGHSPTMEKLLLKLDAGMLDDRLPKDIDAFETGSLPGIGRDIPIVRLGGDRYRDQPVYVRVNPQTGDCFGIKYTLAPGNRLEAIPLPVASRLKNILHSGLSGRGAGKVAKIWTQQRSVDTLVSHQLNGVECTAHISRYGEPGSEALLFPELGIHLEQSPLDFAQYQAVYSSLTVSQSIALHLWTMESGASKNYRHKDVMLNLESFMVAKSTINDNLWGRLPLDKWKPSDRLIYADLTDALKRPFPRQQGSYLGVAQYPAMVSIPWGDTLGPGDIVTHYPTFMTVASEDKYARILTLRADREGLSGNQNRQAVAYFKIENARRAIPLLFNKEDRQILGIEYVFKPDTLFRVKSVSTAYLLEGQIHPSRRIGVVLEEFDGPVNEVKSIFTGNILPVGTAEWANIVKTYS